MKFPLIPLILLKLNSNLDFNKCKYKGLGIRPKPSTFKNDQLM